MIQPKIPFRNSLSDNGRMEGRLSRLLSFLTPLVILLLVYVLFGMFPFGQKSLLITDMSQIYVDFHSWFYDALKGGDSLLFSWNTGLGMNMVGALTFYLSSPFSFLVLLFERSQIPDALLLIKGRLLWIHFFLLFLQSAQIQWYPQCYIFQHVRFDDLCGGVCP